ncbi:DUF4381 domain-containing protein [Bowmanella yangjiangensis]|uniref:DUF4381 domain-containing protein n=1 Tax=Bowmanella yangjiangensis TaxID=2811230 RepID=A0ABS3CPF9_9ALTE|nr:DUF4381 domain-containing protein [Bowmanella yangjiangensis]MBN7818992.1 DUF4381 domain-containing protein [Bowmanella yangjiangensis]
MNANPLAELKDIHLPDPVSAWPPAYGWWLLAAVILALLIFTVRTLVAARRKKLAIRQAQAELASLDLTQPHWPDSLNSLLKRLTLTYLPREASASLHQQAWLNLLAGLLPQKRREAFVRDYQPLLDNLYRADAKLENAEHYRGLAKQWINQALPPSKKRLREAGHV